MTSRYGILLIIPTLLLASTCFGDIIYVDGGVPPGGDGLSWGSAYNCLQDALSAAAIGDEIRVATGVYKPDQGTGITPGDRSATFQLVNGVILKGGYGGETILSGDLNNDDGSSFTNYDENSYHVVCGHGTGVTTVLDGLTITSGNANGTHPHNRGGGMSNISGNPTVTNCEFIKNLAIYGGGIDNWESSPVFDECTFTGNKAKLWDGGAMLNWIGSNATVTNCAFTANQADFRGGAVLNRGNSCIFRNCTFENNSASYFGGGMLNWDADTIVTNCVFRANSTVHNHTYAGGGTYELLSSSVFTNCLFDSNTSYSGAGINSHGSTTRITNCTFVENSALRGTALACFYTGQTAPSNLHVSNSILWDGGDEISNTDGSTIIVSYSCVQDDIAGDGTVYPGTANIDEDPLFTDPEGRLEVGSPCVNMGDNSAIPSSVTTDLDGNPRIVNSVVDMGAYELQVSIIIVEIDVKPGSFPSSVNLKSKGLTPIAIHTTDDFDAIDVVPMSVRLGDCDPTLEPVKYELYDCDEFPNPDYGDPEFPNAPEMIGDSDLDWIFYFETKALICLGNVTDVTLIGITVEGIHFEGTSDISFVKQGNP